MPVIAQIMINTPVEIALREKINRCGCLDLVTESKRLATPVAELRQMMAHTNGVVCNNAGMCCATDVSTFAEKLKRFREDS